jgi:hypothetical protein
MVLFVTVRNRDHASMGHFAHRVFELNRRVVDAEIA